MPREKFKWQIHKDESTDAKYRGGTACSSDEALVMRVERSKEQLGLITSPSKNSRRISRIICTRYGIGSPPEVNFHLTKIVGNFHLSLFFGFIYLL
jgi:hypothetical protein